MKPHLKVSIEGECLDVSYQDSGQWRSYELTCAGHDFNSCEASAHISEIDQDGGEIRTYDIGDASGEVYREAENMIKNALKEAQIQFDEEKVNRQLDEWKARKYE